MTAFWSSLHTRMPRRVLAALGLVGLLALAALIPSAAHASGCTDSWKNAESGSWFTAANWSAGKVPGTEEEACITVSGTYTVTMAQTSAVTVKSLTLGGSEGTQTLAVDSTCSAHAMLTAASGVGVGAHGALTMSNGDGCGDNVTIVAPVTNAGVINSEVEHGGTRTIQGSLTNTGTVNVNQTLAYNGESAALKNEGTINVANEKALAVSNKGSFTNGSGGKVVATGTGAVSLVSGTSFTEGAGTTSGTKPVVVDDAALKYESSGGESTIALHGEASTLSGSSSAKQTLAIESTCGEHAKTTAGSGFTNGGKILLTNGDGCGNNAVLVITSPAVLANSGTISSEVEHGGTRTIQGSLTNTGTVNVNQTLAYNGESAALKNEGTINVANETSLTVSNKGSFTNGTGGKIVATGNGNVLTAASSAGFTEGAGTTSGTKPVIVDDVELKYEPSGGASTIAIHGEAATLAGNLAAGQALSVESTCGEHAKTTAAASFTNAGTIALTNGDGCGNNAVLVITSPATLTNSGTIASEVPHGGARAIEGNLTNTGTLQINTNTSYNATAATLKNEGTIDIATERSLAVSGASTVTNEAGSIAATGSGALTETSGTFNEGGGKTSGTAPVILDDTALHYTGKGAPSVIGLRGEGSTLTGPINSKQTLSIQSSCTEHARTSASGTLVNSGTIILTNGDGCGNNATLNLAGGTLENKGTVKAEEPHGGSRAIEGALKNEKTLTLGPGATLKVASFTQTSKGSATTEIAGTSSFGALASSGPASLAGALSVKALKKFKGALGNSFAVVSSSARTGVFSDMDSAVISKTTPLYYRPVYSATGVTLVVTQPVLSATPSEGAPGVKVKLKGSGFVAEDTVKLVFTDSAAAKTTYANATANASGEFEAEVEVPAAAAVGAGKFTATSTIAEVAPTTAFKVT